MRWDISSPLVPIFNNNNYHKKEKIVCTVTQKDTLGNVKETKWYSPSIVLYHYTPLKSSCNPEHELNTTALSHYHGTVAVGVITKGLCLSPTRLNLSLNLGPHRHREISTRFHILPLTELQSFHLSIIAWSITSHAAGPGSISIVEVFRGFPSTVRQMSENLGLIRPRLSYGHPISSKPHFIRLRTATVSDISFSTRSSLNNKE